MSSYTCPVCGYPGLFEPPWDDSVPSDEVCPSCGTHFGYDDVAGGDAHARRDVHRHLRGLWLSRGCPWFSTSRPEPPEWDSTQQLQAVADSD